SDGVACHDITVWTSIGEAVQHETPWPGLADVSGFREASMKVDPSRTPRRDVLKAAAAAALLGALPLGGPAAFAQAKKPKIGVIGSGNVGSAIGRSWARAGYDVMFSSRNLDSDKKLAAEVGAHARAGTPKEAATFGDVLLFAVPYSALPELGKSLGDSLK